MMTNKQHDDAWLNVHNKVLPGIWEELITNNELLILKQLWENKVITDEAYGKAMLYICNKYYVHISDDDLTLEGRELA